jgi:hypothetical protein
MRLWGPSRLPMRTCAQSRHVPFELLKPLLGADLTSRQVFELIVPALVNAGLEDTCSRLIDFLTVALVQPTEERSEPYTLIPQLRTAGYIPGLEAISHRRETIIYRDLPALHPAVSRPTSSDPALLDVARGMRDMVAEAHDERTARFDNWEEARRHRTIREKLGEAIVDRHLLLCGVSNDDALPALYHEWAAHPCELSERWVMQQAVDAYCASQGMPPFEVTPTHVMAFKNFRFAGISYFDIETGLPPFSVTPDDATSPADRVMLAIDRGRGNAFNLGTDPESGAISPSDVGRLRNTGGYVPQSWTEARAQLRSTSGLLGALVGNNHPVMLVYGRFLRMYERMQTRLESGLDDSHGRRLDPAIMNFHAQLAWRNWLVTQLDSSDEALSALRIFAKA